MCRANEHQFHKEKHKNWSLLIHEKINLEEAIKLIPFGDGSYYDDLKFKRVRSSSSARVFLASCQYNGRTTQVYVKHYLSRSNLDFFKHLFRSGRGKRAFHASLMLKESGFNAPAPLVLMQKSLGPFRTRNILVTEAMSAHIQLNEKLKQLAFCTDLASRKDKRVLLADFGKTIGRMHDQGIIHGDLRVGNVMVKQQDNIFACCFIDNERTTKHRKAPLKLIKKNLVQVNMFRTGISNTDRVRFMNAYAAQRGLSRGDVKNLSRLVNDRTRQRLEKKGRA